MQRTVAVKFRGDADVHCFVHGDAGLIKGLLMRMRGGWIINQ